MKNLFVILITVLAIQPAYSGEKVIKSLQNIVWKSDLEIVDTTFVWNVRGYACQWPGLAVPTRSIRPNLSHPNWVSVEGTIALGIENPNYQFCGPDGIETGTQLLGEEYKVGKTIPVELTTTLERILMCNVPDCTPDNSEEYLRETLQMEILGKSFISTSIIQL
jgi:hypothetical protein